MGTSVDRADMLGKAHIAGLSAGSAENTTLIE